MTRRRRVFRVKLSALGVWVARGLVEDELARVERVLAEDPLRPSDRGSVHDYRAALFALEAALPPAGAVAWVCEDGEGGER